jgi:hypothetical protein
MAAPVPALPSAGTVYIEVQVDAELRDQGRCADLMKLARILNMGGVSNDNVVPLMTGIESTGEWPMADPGNMRIGLPSGYWRNWISDRSYLADRIDGAIAHALARADISAIVLVCVGDSDENLFGRGPMHLTPANFVWWSLRSTIMHKIFLVVLDGDCSTAFALRAWREITRKVTASPFAQLLHDNVGFIASGRAVSEVSTPLVTRDPGSVPTFRTATGCLPTEYVAGFFIRGSMFFREFNRVLAYGAPWLVPGPTIREFVRMLNSTFVERQGFCAEYVGGRDVSLLNVDALFPVGRRKTGEAVDDGSGLSMGELVPNIPVPFLYDDAGNLWDGLGDEQGYREELIEVKRIGFALDTAGVQRINRTVVNGPGFHPLVEELPLLPVFAMPAPLGAGKRVPGTVAPGAPPPSLPPGWTDDAGPGAAPAAVAAPAHGQAPSQAPDQGNSTQTRMGA